MTTTQSFAPPVSTASTVLNATAQSFVPPLCTMSSMLKATAQSFVPPVLPVMVTPVSSTEFTMPSRLASVMVPAADVMKCESSPPRHRGMAWQVSCGLAHWDERQDGMAQPERLIQQPALWPDKAQTEPPEATGTNCQTQVQRPRKGIRNKAIKKTDQGLKIADASPSSHQELLDSGSGVLPDREQQSPQKIWNTTVENMDNGVEFADTCPMQHQANCDLEAPVSFIKVLNLEPVHGPPAAHFSRGGILESFGTSERMSADVSSPCAVGPPGLGRRRAYRSPAKRSRDQTRLNGRERHHEQPTTEIEKESSDDGPTDIGAIVQAPDEPIPLSIGDLLKWRFLVMGEGLPENVVLCSAVRFVKSEDHAPKEEKKMKVAKENQTENHQSVKPLLKESENSWSAQQKQVTKNLNSEGKSDEEIVRVMKSILNKLTIKKYDTLYQQLLHCGMSTSEHVKILIDEVLEKAETQHHFIQMYCQLCLDLHKWLAEHNSAESVDVRERSFKRILLNQCQNKFEENLLPLDLSGMNEAKAEEAMIKHKHAVLGNIKFIGALLEKQMLKDSLLIGIAQELCSDVGNLESLWCFLKAVGPTFDQPCFKHYERLQVIFVQVEEKSKDTSIAARIRFLLKDLLDLRKAHWRSAG